MGFLFPEFRFVGLPDPSFLCSSQESSQPKSLGWKTLSRRRRDAAGSL
ncbi:hypothetical protein AGRO_2946 [Agrobacterium sp. ATCC 31749]|nr:hypothetical protein AGRO_2946 [Agrobacterium sp. ATCC 31749]